jgi:hypothetical protein
MVNLFFSGGCCQSRCHAGPGRDREREPRSQDAVSGDCRGEVQESCAPTLGPWRGWARRERRQAADGKPLGHLANPVSVYGTYHPGGQAEEEG